MNLASPYNLNQTIQSNFNDLEAFYLGLTPTANNVSASLAVPETQATVQAGGRLPCNYPFALQSGKFLHCYILGEQAYQVEAELAKVFSSYKSKKAYPENKFIESLLVGALGSQEVQISFPMGNKKKAFVTPLIFFIVRKVSGNRTHGGAHIYLHYKKQTSFDPEMELDSLNALKRQLEALAAPHQLFPTIYANFYELEQFYKKLVETSSVQKGETLSSPFDSLFKCFLSMNAEATFYLDKQSSEVVTICNDYKLRKNSEQAKVHFNKNGFAQLSGPIHFKVGEQPTYQNKISRSALFVLHENGAELVIALCPGDLDFHTSLDFWRKMKKYLLHYTGGEPLLKHIEDNFNLLEQYYTEKTNQSSNVIWDVDHYVGGLLKATRRLNLQGNLRLLLQQLSTGM